MLSDKKVNWEFVVSRSAVKKICIQPFMFLVIIVNGNVGKVMKKLKTGISTNGE